jgi:hypothetical protein
VGRGKACRQAQAEPGRTGQQAVPAGAQAAHRPPGRPFVRDYLARGDYLRAAQFGFEALISGKVIENQGDPGNFITLKNLRNALSHGLRAKVDAQAAATQRTAEFVDRLLADGRGQAEKLVEGMLQGLARISQGGGGGRQATASDRLQPPG